jgi:hypothetical protein
MCVGAVHAHTGLSALNIADQIECRMILWLESRWKKWRMMHLPFPALSACVDVAMESSSETETVSCRIVLDGLERIAKADLPSPALSASQPTYCPAKQQWLAYGFTSTRI